MKFFVLFFIVLSISLGAQEKTVPPSQQERDRFFGANRPSGENPSEKIKLIHSDSAGVRPNKYDGNFMFYGNVKFSHNGSTFTADEVIIFQEENVVKAFGNVHLMNPDGSVITSDEMEYDGNVERGIANKNAVLKDPKQTIKTETLYYDKKSNLAYFNTGGTIEDNTGTTMYTKSATYDVTTKIIDFTGNVRIDHPDYILEGNNVKQNQQTNTAFINGPTNIYDKKNTLNKIYTEGGRFERNSNEVYLEKNPVVYYNNKILRGNLMYGNRNTGFWKVQDNVYLDDQEQKRFIKGGYAEVYQNQDSAMITQKPYAVKIMDKDSIYFSAERFIAYQKKDSMNPDKKLSFFRAFNKARMYKSNAQARADSISFNETDGILHLNKSPILWSGEKQVTGDKIEAYFNTENNHIDSVKVIGKAFAISKSDTLNDKDEFDQIKGKLMVVYYENNESKNAKVQGNSQAITYSDDTNQKTKEKERIGVNLSTCGEIEAEFVERKINIISCNIGANIDTYPMSMISKKQRFFPEFNWNTKDRLKKWQDIFLDSPSYEEKMYRSDNSLYERAQDEIKKKKEEEDAKKPKRVRK